MKKLFARKQIFILLIVLALAQFACNLGARAASIATQASGAITQSSSTSVPQAAPTVAATSSAHGTPDEAQAMLKLAIAHYQTVGREQALKDFTNRVAPFFDRDLYVACIDSHLIQSANGGFPNLVGSAQEPLGRARWDAATTSNISSITYAYINPATGITEPKTFYYEKVGTDVCGVGAYQP
ncbi:MAG: hypothetical protein WBW94_17255 [Anaerolineales bacterium]